MRGLVNKPAPSSTPGSVRETKAPESPMVLGTVGHAVGGISFAPPARLATPPIQRRRVRASSSTVASAPIQRVPLAAGTRAELDRLRNAGGAGAYGAAYERLLADGQQRDEYHAHLAVGTRAADHHALVHAHMATLLRNSHMYRHNNLRDDNAAAGQHGVYMTHLTAQRQDAEYTKKTLGEQVVGQAGPQVYNHTADFSGTELRSMRDVWRSLPAAHVAGI
ncbi:MAG: hypothetical protein AAFY88_25985, partial [Acidobacteriota bacterium]